MTTTAEPLPDLSAFVLHPKPNPIERAVSDEAGQLAMLDAMDESKAVFQ
ncbi:hypothetical protein LF41_2393 [Lysobacter dokdonensis DS-58]|uniref:Uncharacterized protein n=1 Tax=Lysobacter dokdonensis DS-58 TaxID=1300345 RepID=A0A0A2WI71_9GAMM|nr:hypothetical protein [Lysobacter dokdonensis]KGQ19886.1 hypothetical protein LF41_2393 [Lysobacter dokdonensis DS-58]